MKKFEVMRQHRKDIDHKAEETYRQCSRAAPSLHLVIAPSQHKSISSAHLHCLRPTIWIASERAHDNLARRRTILPPHESAFQGGTELPSGKRAAHQTVVLVWDRRGVDGERFEPVGDVHGTEGDWGLDVQAVDVGKYAREVGAETARETA